MSWLIALILVTSSTLQANDPRPSIDLKMAAQYFAEAEAVCREDGGKLWGKSLCGPMLFADPRSRMVVGNRADAEGKLTAEDQVFVGKLPETQTIANTATEWAGVKWTMVMWPLPTNPAARRQLMAHELYHRIQSEIGLPANNPSNGHLDSKDGRILLQLEWRALAHALTNTGNERKTAIEDALTFRARRRELFPDAAANERALEMNEGLAEYTGVKLRGTTSREKADYVATRLRGADMPASFVRSFAYVSGPAYCLLLDDSGGDWRKGLKQDDDLGDIAARLFAIQRESDPKRQSDLRTERYDGQTLIRAESEREVQRQNRLADYRKRFVDGPVLVLPLGKEVNYSFDPNDVQIFDETRTVYGFLRMSDAWGILTVTKGALLTRSGARLADVTVAAPSNSTGQKLEGEGWTLQLNSGWRIESGTRKGDYIVRSVN